mmetsp:Transcript_50187/g.81005  ORF Transcript_50187/g.81005 Transcript_50187/m.81005 type:complete len:211 (+) Transcript_50187:837-1469(+)
MRYNGLRQRAGSARPVRQIDIGNSESESLARHPYLQVHGGATPVANAISKLAVLEVKVTAQSAHVKPSPLPHALCSCLTAALRAAVMPAKHACLGVHAHRQSLERGFGGHPLDSPGSITQVQRCRCRRREFDTHFYAAMHAAYQTQVDACVCHFTSKPLADAEHVGITLENYSHHTTHLHSAQFDHGPNATPLIVASADRRHAREPKGRP